MSHLKEKNKSAPLLWAEVDLKKLRANLNAIRAHLGRSGKTGILAVVKADAYGHGMIPVARALWKNGVKFFGVATIEEALTLRKAIPACRILVLGSFHRNQAQLFIKNRITPTVSSEEDAGILNNQCRGKKRFAVHIKIDTGMGRLGVWHEEAREFFQRFLNFNHLEAEGIYTHFSSADHADTAPTTNQLKRFNAALSEARRLGIKPVFIHAANSLGLSRFNQAHFNLVRPGIILYGMNPNPAKKLPFKVQPILSLKTRISFLKSAGKGRSISYGGTFTTKSRTQIATLPVGYSHGYRVGFSNKAFVLVNGVRCPVVGRVTMDQTLVDVGKANAKRWDLVTLIGRDRQEQVKSEHLAGLIGSIPYEIVCALHSRIPRIYKEI